MNEHFQVFQNFSPPALADYLNKTKQALNTIQIVFGTHLLQNRHMTKEKQLLWHKSFFFRGEEKNVSFNKFPEGGE